MAFDSQNTIFNHFLFAKISSQTANYEDNQVDTTTKNKFLYYVDKQDPSDKIEPFQGELIKFDIRSVLQRSNQIEEMPTELKDMYDFIRELNPILAENKDIFIPTNIIDQEYMFEEEFHGPISISSTIEEEIVLYGEEALKFRENITNPDPQRVLLRKKTISESIDYYKQMSNDHE